MFELRFELQTLYSFTLNFVNFALCVFVLYFGANLAETIGCIAMSLHALLIFI